MDFDNFSSESNSIFVIQESSTNEEDDDEEEESGIKSDDFEMSDEKSIIQINSDDELKEIDNKVIIDTHESLKDGSVGVDHDYGSAVKDGNISLNDYIMNSEDISESEDKISGGTESVNIRAEDFISIKEEQFHISASDQIVNYQDNCSPSGTNLNEDTSEKVLSCVLSDGVQDTEENLHKKSTTSVSEVTCDPPKKLFKPICITGVKSLIITKSDVNTEKSTQNFNYSFDKGEDFNSSCSSFDRSDLWKYYSKLNLEEIQCIFCLKKFLFSSASSNLLQHLLSQHKNEVKFDCKLKCTFETEKSFNNSFNTKNGRTLLNDKSKGKKISRIWTNFSKSKLGKVTCNICCKTISYRHSNSALLRHLRFSHLYTYNKHVDNAFKNIRGYKQTTTICNIKNEMEDIVESDPSSSSNTIFEQISSDKKVCFVRKPSETWKYFTQITTDKIRCNICDTILKFVDGVSSNLTRHLRRKHFGIYSKFNPWMKLNDITCKPAFERNPIKKKKFKKLHHKPRSLMDYMNNSDNNVSKIRKYFTKFSSSKVRCIACHGLLPYTFGSTFNLKNHIIMKHEDIFERIVASIYNGYESFKTITEDGKKLLKKNEKIKLIWKYFTSMKSGKLKCNLCTDGLPFYCNVFDSLQHLHFKHKISYSDVAEEFSTPTIKDVTPKENEISVKDVDKIPANSVTDFEKPNETMVTDRTWKYFTKIYHDKTIEVKCNLCNDIFSYTHGVNSNLIYHLNLVHKNSYCESDPAFLIPEETLENKVQENKFEKSGNNFTVNSKSKVTKSSKTWKYYTLVGQCKAKCNICSMELSFQFRSNSNLTRHLKRRHKDVYDLIYNPESTTDEIEMNLNQSHCTDDKTVVTQLISLEMKRMYEYLEGDIKLKNLVILESTGLKCKICQKMFPNVDFSNCLAMLRQHMQINHAEWKIVCADNVISCKEEILTSVYNELEAIANEVESYKENNDLSKTLDKSESAEKSTLDDLDNSLNETYKNVWKYFTKLTSTNVRCNFCSILLSYRTSKKWNLYRHLHLKHLSKLDDDDVEVLKKIHGTHRPKPASPKLANKSSPVKRKSNSGHKSPSKRKQSRSDERVRRSDSSMDDSISGSNLGRYWSVKPELFNRIGRTWSHFTKVDMGKATCNICHKTLRYLGNGSDVLNKHLNRHHINKKFKPDKPNLSLGSSSDSSDNSSDKYNNVRSIKLRSEKKVEPRIREDKKLSSEEIENIILKDNKKNDKNSTSESEDSELEYIYNDSEFTSEEEKQKTSKSRLNTFEKGRKSLKKKLNRRETTSSTSEKSFDESISQSRNKVWTYYTNLENGFAKCHLCLIQISYESQIINLVRHLQKIHSVVSLSDPTNEYHDSNYEEKNGKSQLLAAIDLKPNKSKENAKQICFTKLNETSVKCNFCSHLFLSYKKDDIHILNSHLQNCREIKDYNSLLLNSFKFFENDDDDLNRTVLVNEVKSGASNQYDSSHNLFDQNYVPIKRCNTWLYYTKLNNDFVQCNICSNKLSFKGGSVYNLNRHLSIKHNIKLSKPRSFSKEKSYSKETKLMPKIFKICKKKSGTLSFYSRVNRYVVKCKLCSKRFIYKGVNINRLISHLWSVHIARLIEFNSESVPSVSEPLTESDDEKTESISAVTGCTSNMLKMINKLTTDGIDKPESGRKFSNTWKYFTKRSDKDCKASCNICFKYFSYKNGNVSNLSRHLLRNHGIKLIKAIPRFREVCETEKKNADSNISIINEGPLINTSLTDMYMKNFKTGKPGKPPFSVPFTDVCKKEINETNLNPANGNDGIWKYFDKRSEDEVECITCNEKITIEEGKVSNLQNHLFSVHKIKVLSYVPPLSVVASKGDVMKIVKPFNKINSEHVDDNYSFKNTNTKLKRYVSKMKCKLCYKYLIFTGKKSYKWVNHLNDHEKELSVDEKSLLLTLKDIEDANFKENENKTSGCEMLVYKYFKNLKLFKRKCKICGKFISSKIHCSHRISNDISVTYGINRNRFKNSTASTKTEKLNKLKKISLDIDEDNNSQISCKTKYVKSCGVKNVIHFMSINKFDNKCTLCCGSLINKGYCSHSLNQWWVESQQNKPDELEDHVKVEDELEIITDALSDGENKIIIITDDGAPSVLNYEDANKDCKEDVAYQVVNAESENNDDIQVIIYNFNPEENGNSFDEISNNIKIGEIQEDSGGTIQPCNKELEEQVKVILQELNNANSYSNQIKGTEMFKCDKKLIGSEKLSSNQPNVLPVKDKSLNSAETSLDQLPIKLNKTEINCLDEEVSEIVSESLSDEKNSLDYGLQSANASHKSIHGSTLASIDQRAKTIVEPVNQPYEWLSKGDESIVEFTDVINAIDSNFKTIQQTEKDELEGAKISHQSKVTLDETEKRNSEEFKEANVSLEKPAEEFNNFDTNMHQSDVFDIKSGMVLQKLKSCMINKILIFFSKINFKYKSAKCNLCSSYVFFKKPIIYNLLTHLYLKHENRIISFEAPESYDKNGKKIVDLLNSYEANINYGDMKPRRKCPVWKFFINDSNCRATCKICRFNFSYKGGAVNNLGRHLRLRHNILVSTRNATDDYVDNYDEDVINCLKDYPTLPKKRASVKLRSKTWNYFTKEPNDWAKCILCKKYLSYRSSTINNLRRHLRTVHANIYHSLSLEDNTELKDDLTGQSELNDEIYKNILLDNSSSRSRDEVLQECSYASSERSGTKRKSVVWNYFTEECRDSGRCNFCLKLISCKGGGTSNLSRHLRVKHGIWIVMTSTLSEKYEEEFTSVNENNEIDPTLNQNEDLSQSQIDTIITHEQLHILKKRKIMNRRSKTWEFFAKESSDRVVCKICAKTLSYKCKAVHNLRRHLAIKHPNHISKRDPPRIKLQISNENLSIDSEGQNHSVDTDKTYIDITDTSVVIVDEENAPPVRKGDRVSRPKKSYAWNYFDELEYGVAKCSMCGKILSIRGGGTNNLMRHLRSRHSMFIDNATVVASSEVVPMVETEKLQAESSFVLINENST